MKTFVRCLLDFHMLTAIAGDISLRRDLPSLPTSDEQNIGDFFLKWVQVLFKVLKYITST